VKYFNCFFSTLKNDARFTCEKKSGISRAKIAINKKKAFFFRFMFPCISDDNNELKKPTRCIIVLK
jgi:hypothetical protein